MTTQAFVKPSDQSVTSSTALVNETALVIAMGASDTWIVTWKLFVTYVTGTSGGIKLAVTTPTGATLLVMGVATSIATGAGVTGSQSTSLSGTGVTLLSVTGNGTSAIVTVTASVVGDGTHAGNITLQFAQNGVSATSTTVKAGSSVTAVQH